MGESMMQTSGKYVNDYNWWETTKSRTDEDAVCKITATADDALKAPCDNCGEKTLTLYPVKVGQVDGTPLDDHDYLCGDCV